MRKFIAVLVSVLLLSACQPKQDVAQQRPVVPVTTAEPTVSVVQRDGRYLLLRDGQPYQIKGAGIDSDSLESFAAHGGNSFRTWRTDNAQHVLDKAHELGLTVTMCIEIGRERHGFDYDDDDAVAAQLEFARQEVLKYKDHPALLVWMIGNEPNLFFENPRVFDAVNDISKMIHEVDPNHPTTTALAGFSQELADLIGERASDLDFVSIQMYGDIVNLPGYIDEIGFTGPFMVTEWGAIGHWEVAKTDWDAPIEQTSSEKADNYQLSYRTAIASNPQQIVGSYVFLWGQKQERTPTWYGMALADGAETETVDVMHRIWNGQWPDNRAPRVQRLTLNQQSAHDSVRLKPGEVYPAEIGAVDPDGDSLRFRWEVMRESQATQAGGDKEDVPELIEGLIDDPSQPSIQVTGPTEPGPYRLFVYAYDGNENAGHANIPFLVE